MPCSILVELSSSFFPMHLFSIHVVHPYGSMDMTVALKKLRFILSESSDFHMIDSLSRAYHAFASCVLMSFSVDEMLLVRQVNLSTSFKESTVRVEMFLV